MQVKRPSFEGQIITINSKNDFKSLYKPLIKALFLIRRFSNGS